MSGGKSAITGFDYQLWYVAYELSKAFFDENLIVKPEAQLRPIINEIQPNSNPENDIISVDDLYVQNGGKEHYFNIKVDVPPNYKDWTIPALINAKVISQFKEQFEKTPDGELILITQSPANIIKRVFEKVSSATNEEQALHFLETKDKKYLNEWHKLKEALGYDSKRTLKFASKVTIKVCPFKDIKEWIQTKFQNHITNHKNVGVHLKEYATILSKKENGQATQSKIISYLKKQGLLSKVLSNSDILRKLKFFSSGLRNQSKIFGQLLNTTIQRSEEQSIFEFINKKTDHAGSSILILSGDAGYGKTTILNNILSKLEQNDIPVLGIKADSFSSVNSYSQLLEDLQLNSDFEKILSGLSEKHSQIVILIDQLDALSQYLASNRTPLKLFKQFIHSVNSNTPNNVKVIISCRSYDLFSDPELNDLTRDTIIRVGLLKKEEIQIVLDKMNLQYDNFPNDLKNLLRVPLHLNVFCRIYDHNTIPLEDINVLEDLYDEAWKQQIQYPASQNNVTSDKLEQQVFEIVDKMYEFQKIYVSKKIFKKSTELDYLTSQGLVIQGDSNLHFFHQTFYDYCYSLSFFKNERSLSSTILENHQGTFTRTQVRMVLAYLRGRDRKSYIKELTTLLTSDTCRFHIKVLLIQSLANEPSPFLLEKTLVEKIILPNQEFLDLFIEGLNSLQWFDYLIRKGVCNNLLLEGKHDEVKRNSLITLLHKMLNDFPEETLQYLDGVPEADHIPDLVIRLLAGLNNWTFPTAINLFEKFEWVYEDKVINSGVDKSWVFENSYSQQNKWTIKKILEEVEEFVEDKVSKLSEEENYSSTYDGLCLIGDDHHNLLTNLFEKFPETILSLGLPIFNTIIQKTKEAPFTENGKIFLDYGFYFRNEKPPYYEGHLFLREQITAWIKVIATEDKGLFSSLTSKFISTNSASLIQIVLIGYASQPELYTQEFFNLFKLLDKENILTLHQNINVDVRSSLKSIFPFFNSEQKKWFTQWLITLKSIQELSVKTWFNGKKYHPRSFGKTQLLYLQCLPLNFISSNRKLHKRHKELKRKFSEKILDKRLRETNFQFSAVHSPITKDSFSRMSYPSIVSAFENLREKNIGGEKYDGNVFSLAQGFYTAVEEAPNKFAPLVEKLISENVRDTYKVRGLEALIKSTAYNDLDTILRIFKKSLNILDQDQTSLLSLLDNIEYFIRNKYIDEEILDFLEFCVLTYIEPKPANNNTKRGNEINQALRGVKGVACGLLVYINYNEDFKIRVFSILNKAVNSKSRVARIATIRRLAYLSKIDSEATVSLFLKIVKAKELRVFEYSTWSAQYLCKYGFLTIKSYFEYGMTISTIQKHIGQILTIAWLNNYDESEELLSKALSLSDKAKIGSLSIAFNNVKDQDVKNKCWKLINRFILSKSNDIKNSFFSAIRNHPEIEFPLVAPFFTNALKHYNSTRDLTGFCYYIEKQVSKYPIECIKIFTNFSLYNNLKLYQINFHASPLKVVLGAYQIFLDDNDDEWMENSMELFDLLMKSKAIRQGYKRYNPSE